MSNGNIDELRERLRERLSSRPEISFAYLHGSSTEGIPFRDLDVAVYLRSSQVGDPFDYETALSVELTRELSFPVDVHVLNGARLGFQHRALQGEPLLVRDEDRLTCFIERVARQYMEFAYLGRRYLLDVTS